MLRAAMLAVLRAAMLAVAVTGVTVAVTGVAAQDKEAPVVRTDGGWVAGMTEETLKGRTIYSYRAIPFAKPPVGRLRFKPPEASHGWEGVRNSSVHPPMCLQVSLFKAQAETRDVFGSEDCLYLNVHTPVDDSGDRTSKLPVMVFIHGGAFFCGAASDYGPYALLEHDVILVTLQYRLGILGFLSTEDEVLPGNMGLLDQVEGLRWVQRNIIAFGGDPDRVTIYGGSAGGASVHYHLLSPSTKGLFSGAIMQSGSALNPWARGGSFRQVAELVGHDLGCPDLDHSPALLACLQKTPDDALVASIYDFIMFGMSPVMLAPRVDGVYLEEDPALLVKEGRHHQVPAVFGTTSHEGALTTALLYATPALMAIMTETTEVQMASLELGEGDVAPSALAAHIFRHYMGGPHFGEEQAEAVTQMYGDRLFVVGQEISSRHYALRGPTFTYEFTHVGQHSFTSVFGATQLPYQWAGHGEELMYLFPGGEVMKNFVLSTPEDLQLQETLVQLWVNFATTRNPTPDASLGFTWDPLSPGDPHHLDLNPTPTMAPDHRQEVLDFWASLPLQENLVLAPENVTYEHGHREEL